LQHAEDGERHIADVKTHHGWVLEFQHSRIDPEERRAREAFYPHLLRVVDARKQRDVVHFLRAWAKGEARDPLSSKRRLACPASSLLRQWSGSPAHVFFDIGDPDMIWWLFPDSRAERGYVQYISRAQFVRVHREKGAHAPREFDSLIQNFCAFIALYEPLPTIPVPRASADSHMPARPRQIIRRSFRFLRSRMNATAGAPGPKVLSRSCPRRRTIRRRLSHGIGRRGPASLRARLFRGCRLQIPLQGNSFSAVSAMVKFFATCEPI
jgi:hypothetical protein